MQQRIPELVTGPDASAGISSELRVKRPDLYQTRAVSPIRAGSSPPVGDQDARDTPVSRSSAEETVSTNWTGALEIPDTLPQHIELPHDPTEQMKLETNASIQARAARFVAEKASVRERVEALRHMLLHHTLDDLQLYTEEDRNMCRWFNSRA